MSTSNYHLTRLNLFCCLGYLCQCLYDQEETIKCCCICPLVTNDHRHTQNYDFSVSGGIYTLFRHILSKQSKLPVSAEIWCLHQFEYAECSDVYLFHFRPEIPVQDKSSLKNQNCQFQLKFDIQTNSNMQDSMVVLTFSVFDRIFTSFVQKSIWNFDVLRLISRQFIRKSLKPVAFLVSI